MFDIRHKRPLAILSNHSKPVNVVLFTQDKYLISAGEDMNIFIWDIYKNGNRLSVCFDHCYEYNTCNVTAQIE